MGTRLLFIYHLKWSKWTQLEPKQTNRLQSEQFICLIECIAEFRSFYKFEGKSSTKAKILILSPGKQRTSLANDLFNFAIFLERLGGSARIIQHWFIASLNPGISVTHDECVTENKLKMLATCPSKKICVFGSSRLDDVQTPSCGIYEHLWKPDKVHLGSVYSNVRG